MNNVKKFFDFLEKEGLFFSFTNDVLEWKNSEGVETFLIDDIESSIPLEFQEDYLKEVKMYRGITTQNEDIYANEIMTSWTTSREAALESTKDDESIEMILEEDIPQTMGELESSGDEDKFKEYMDKVEIKGIVFMKEGKGLMLDDLIKDLYEYANEYLLNDKIDFDTLDENQVSNKSLYENTIRELGYLVDGFDKEEEEVLSLFCSDDENTKIVDRIVLVNNEDVLSEVDYENSYESFDSL